jgi:hypothetical protein
LTLIYQARDVDDQLAAAISSSSTGLDVKQSVRLATTVSVGTYNATGGAKVEGNLRLLLTQLMDLLFWQVTGFWLKIILILQQTVFM